MKSVLIIGMGTLGRHLARKVAELGNEVLIMDEDEEVIQELAQEFPNAVSGDCTSEGVLRSLGVSNFDYCFFTVFFSINININNSIFFNYIKCWSLIISLNCKSNFSAALRHITIRFKKISK